MITYSIPKLLQSQFLPRHVRSKVALHTLTRPGDESIVSCGAARLSCR